MLTTEGGVEIEEVAATNPDALSRLHVDPLEGFQPYQARRLIYGAGIEDESEQKQILGIVEKLYRCFVESDAMLCEINPLIVTPGRARCARSTRSSRSTTTRSSATRTSPRCATPTRTRPRSASRARRTSPT